MELDGQEVLARHGVQVSVQRIDDDYTSIAILHCVTHQVSELTGRQLGWVDLLSRDEPRLEMLVERHAEPRRSDAERVHAFVECKDGGMSAAIGRSRGKLRSDRTFARSGRPNQQNTGPSIEPAPYQR